MQLLRPSSWLSSSLPLLLPPLLPLLLLLLPATLPLSLLLLPGFAFP